MRKKVFFGLRAFRRYVRTPRKIHCTISPRSFSSITPLTSWSPRVNCIGHCNKWHLSKLKESVVTRPAKQVSSVRVELKSEEDINLLLSAKRNRTLDSPLVRSIAEECLGWNIFSEFCSELEAFWGKLMVRTSAWKLRLTFLNRVVQGLTSKYFKALLRSVFKTPELVRRVPQNFAKHC